MLKQITLDASTVPAGSDIKIVKTENIEVDAGSGISYDVNDIDTMLLVLSDDAALSSFSGQRIIVNYHFPTCTVCDIDLASLAEPRFTARLDGNTLYLQYDHKTNIKVIFIPIWSFMWQFDEFKGQHIFQESPGYSFGGGSGSVFISVQ